MKILQSGSKNQQMKMPRNMQCLIGWFGFFFTKQSAEAEDIKSSDRISIFANQVSIRWLVGSEMTHTNTPPRRISLC